MKIVMSWWTKPVAEITTPALERFALSCHLARRHYARVELVTDSLGQDFLVDRLQLPFTAVDTSLDGLSDWDPAFWVTGKLFAYLKQTEPFIHIDDDVFLWERLPKRLEEAPICVQNDEQLHVYRWWLKKLGRADLRYRVLPLRRFVAHNVGLVGGNDLTTLQIYASRALEWVRSLQGRFGLSEAPNIVVEQATLAYEAISQGVRVERLFGSEVWGDTGSVDSPGYSHLTCTKHWPAVKLRVRRELARVCDRAPRLMAGERTTFPWWGHPHPVSDSCCAPVVHHSGDFGDIVFAMSAVNQLAAGGGGRVLNVVLSPEQRMCRVTRTRETMTEEKAKFIAPLLEAQPYIGRVTFQPRMPRRCLDMNQWREEWYHTKDLARRDTTSLAEWGHRYLGTQLDPRQKWLQVLPESTYASERFPITVHRSSRYHNGLFPWHALVKRYGPQMQFVGLVEEWKQFKHEFDLPGMSHVLVSDALQMAKVIASSKMFIGNQSLPCAIAEGLKMPLVQESCPECPDCVFNRPDALYTAEGLVPASRIIAFVDSVLR